MAESANSIAVCLTEEESRAGRDPGPTALKHGPDCSGTKVSISSDFQGARSCWEVYCLPLTHMDILPK